jgi:ATP-binding cassette ChvD family protein
LLGVLARDQPPDLGEVRWAPGISIGILVQEPVLDETKSVRDTVSSGLATTYDLLARYGEVSQQLGEDYTDDLVTELGALQEQLDLLDGWDIDAKVDQAMQALRCPPPDTPIRALSGGQRRRVALCQVLLSQPDLLLLDEPTNHLDTDSVQWLQEHLGFYRGTLVVVTHDRCFLDRVAETIVEVERSHVMKYRGNYTQYLESKCAGLRVNGHRDAEELSSLRRELAWAQSGEVTRLQSAQDRLSRYTQMAARTDRIGPRDQTRIHIPAGPRLGDRVIDVTDLTKVIDGRILFQDLSFSLPRNGIVGVIGPNGIGKTTLFRMLAGEVRPDSGQIAIGDTVQLAYVDQVRAGIDDDRTVWQIISGGQDILQIGSATVSSRAWAAAFGFKGTEQQKPARLLSGGERNRVNLAMTLKQGGNVLLLDEPTNDLDTAALAALEDALAEFAGCAVITAHDRWFLDRVATHVLAWEGPPAQWYWFEGNFTAYRGYRSTHQADGPSGGRLHRRLGGR